MNEEGVASVDIQKKSVSHPVVYFKGKEIIS